MRTPSLPDADTDMDMHAFYVACLKAGLSDLEVVSKIRLYGVRSDSTAATGVDVLQNYKMDADAAAHVNKDREDKLIAFDFVVSNHRRSSAKFRVKRRARLGKSAMHPQGFPYRNLPKAVVRQTKRVCEAYPKGVKLRTVTDAGAIRKPRRSFRSFRSSPAVSKLIQRWHERRHNYLPGDGLGVRLAVNLLQQSAGFSRSADESTDDGADSGWYNRLSAKGEPGVDSVNSCLPEDRTRCKYAAFSDFLATTARAHFRDFGRGAPSPGPPALAHVRGPNSDPAPWAAPKTGQGGRSIATIGLAKFRTCAMCRFFYRTLRYLKLDLAPHYNRYRCEPRRRDAR